MKIHEQRDTLVRAIELALHALPSGPTLSGFGIARDDCALVHIDYFGEVHSAQGVLAGALAEVRGTTTADEWATHGQQGPACDNSCCADKATATEARARCVAAYTNVATWKYDPLTPVLAERSSTLPLR